MDCTIIPAHEKGKQNDLEFSRELPTIKDAIAFFKKARERLLNPALWHELAGAASAVFLLYPAEGNSGTSAAKGDYLRIAIPAPGTVSGDGDDWVRVIAMEDNVTADGTEELAAMTVSPASSPENTNNDIAHFFDAPATSTFVVHRKHGTITASYHGRNELPNNKTEAVLDNIRNTLIATGAALGLSEAQWTALLKGFLQDKNVLS